jgi:hypothetical protein
MPHQDTTSTLTETARKVELNAKLPEYFHNPEPRQHHETLAELLEDIQKYIRRFMTFSDENHPPTIALWILHTWLIDQFVDTGYLHFHSAEKQSGKSRAAEVIGPLCQRYLPMLEPTGPVLYRSIDAFRPTLFIDEVDALFAKKSEEFQGIRAILNGGYRRGNPVMRLDGQKHEPRIFDAFGPKILAGIGSSTLPDTITDRCIPIEMKRRKRSDRTQRYRQDRLGGEHQRLRESIAHFAATLDLRDSDPEIPDELDDRSADIWLPLLAIRRRRRRMVRARPISGHRSQR